MLLEDRFVKVQHSFVSALKAARIGPGDRKSIIAGW